MTLITFTIMGQPIPKSRPRFTKRGIAYTPEKTRVYEDYVRSVSSQYAPNDLLKGALEVELHFFLQRPKTLPKRVVYHIKKPDVDNLCKGILDSLEPRKRPKKSQNPLEGAIYENDAQIVSLYVTKEYGEPRVEVKISDKGLTVDLRPKSFKISSVPFTIPEQQYLIQEEVALIKNVNASLRCL